MDDYASQNHLSRSALIAKATEKYLGSDSETRFRTLAAFGNPKRSIELLDKLNSSSTDS